MTSDTKNKQPQKPWRNWCFTWIEPSDAQVAQLQALGADKCKYLIYGWEATKDGELHLQGYIELPKVQRMTGIKAILDPVNGKKSPVHVEPAVACRSVNKVYCSKGLQSHEEYEEHGTKGPNYGLQADVYEFSAGEQRAGQGKRTDWDALYDRIQEEPDFGTILAEFPKHAIQYPTGIQKAIDTVLQQRNVDRLHAEMDELKLYCWEESLLTELRAEPDRRKIIWYVDHIGGSGKSTFAKYLLSQGDCAYFTNAKTADIAHAYKGERTVIFDFTRSVEGRINYEVIESIKNGIIFAAKYNSGLKVNPTPHIVCFSNFDPDESKLSQDRWDLRPLTADDRRYPIASAAEDVYAPECALDDAAEAAPCEPVLPIGNTEDRSSTETINRIVSPYEDTIEKTPCKHYASAKLAPTVAKQADSQGNTGQVLALRIESDVHPDNIESSDELLLEI